MVSVLHTCTNNIIIQCVSCVWYMAWFYNILSADSSLPTSCPKTAPTKKVSCYSVSNPWHDLFDEQTRINKNFFWKLCPELQVAKP